MKTRTRCYFYSHCSNGSCEFHFPWCFSSLLTEKMTYRFFCLWKGRRGGDCSDNLTHNYIINFLSEDEKQFNCIWWALLRFERLRLEGYHLLSLAQSHRNGHAFNREKNKMHGGSFTSHYLPLRNSHKTEESREGQSICSGVNLIYPGWVKDLQKDCIQ